VSILKITVAAIAVFMMCNTAQAQESASSIAVDGSSLEMVAAEAVAEVADSHNMGLLIFVFVLAIFLGFELIAKVPSQLHTPLMSGSNAISGISVVGALLAAGRGNSTVMIVLGTVAVALAMINVVGGYMVTDRMLGMFKHKTGNK